ncbi:hypothetical protein EYF80_050468 [Liparis tanakae]|uniref:Uncharacterized protein n=1 Tax=Liparis tanakae TaxID=230148 RepID=A0A4Z2FEP6_9TELE|nr:hypothetical protein EYF80_050468 [Liparis tanakae]
MAAPSLTIRSATASSTRPSLVRWAFRRSTRGFPSQSNTSFNVRRALPGLLAPVAIRLHRAPAVPSTLPVNA